MLQSTSDAELLEASARLDSASFAELVLRFYTPVYRMVWRMMNGHAESEDVAQEAFVKLWQNPSQIREARVLKGWLMRVASNLAVDRLRKKPSTDNEVIDEIADPTQRADAELAEKAASDRVDQAIAKLPERQKLVVYFEGMSNISAAAVMDISVDAIESLLTRGRRALRESLTDDWRGLLEELAQR